MKSRLVVVVGLVCAFAGPVSAQEEDEQPLAARFTAGKRVKKRGTLAQMRAHQVSIAGRRTMSAGDLADGLFADQRELTREFRGAKAALLGDPEVSEEVVDTDEATVITTSTKITVVDPDALRQKSTRFGSIRNKQTRDGFALSNLTAAERKKFDKLKDKMKALPAHHPLRKAADTGDDALLDALLDGKGDVTVTTTVVVPKTAPKRTASGQLLVRQVKDDGTVDFSRPVAVDSIGAKIGAGGWRAPTREVEGGKPEKTTAKGKTKTTAQFLTGFTEADDFIWEKRWDFSFGFVSVKFHPWYEFGLRVPVEVKGTLSPDKIVHKGPEDIPYEFEVELTAKPVDGDQTFYKDVGLAADLIKDGKEFLLGAGFEVIVRVNAGWVLDKKWIIPKNASFDWGGDMRPPFGDCGTQCGKDFWIDADYTHTKLNLLNVVTGSARVGFKLTGDGEVRVDYEALDGNDEIPSWEAGHKGEKRKKHTLSFGRSSDTRRMKAEAGPVVRDGATRQYGYRLSNPRYDWKVTLTPGVRGDIRVKAKPLLDDHFAIGPLWLDPFAIKLGTVHLDAHKGTKDSYKLKQGDKTWQKQ